MPAPALSVRSARLRSIAVYPATRRYADTAARPVPRRTVLGATAFRIVWCCIFSLHVFCGSFVLLFAALHAFISQPTMFAYSFTVLQIQLPFLQCGTIVCGALAFAHFAVAGRMIYRSIRQRQLSFVLLRRRHSRNPLNRDRLAKRASLIVRCYRALGWFVVAPFSIVYGQYRRYFGVDGLFGLNGAYFEGYVTLRETVEILSQLYQTFQLSYAVSGRWINRFAVSVLIINTFSTPLINVLCRVQRSSESTRRLATLVADLVLDFCGSFLVPVCILFQIGSEFDWSTYTLPPQVVYSDAWLAYVVADTRQLLISSTPDLVSFLVLNLGVVGALLMIAVDIRREQPGSKVHTTLGIDSSRELSQVQMAVSRPKTRLAQTLRFVLECIFFVSGIAVLAVHVVSQRELSEVPACLLHVDAWFAKRFPCAVVRINCQKLAVGQDVVSVLDTLEPLVVTSMIMAHCSDTLVVPNELNLFSEIRQLKFVNVSSIAWSDGVRIDHEHHPTLGYILFGHTNMTQIPSVLLHERLPQSLREIEWSHSNLTELPSDVGRFWGNRVWIAVSFDHTQVETLPHSFSDIPIQYLWLVDNKLKTVPAALFASEKLQRITLSGNPMEALPPVVPNVSTVLSKVFIEFTTIADVPRWLETWYARDSLPVLSLYGSAFCSDATSSSQATDLLRLRDEACAQDYNSIRGTIDWEYVWMNQRDP